MSKKLDGVVVKTWGWEVDLVGVWVLDVLVERFFNLVLVVFCVK